MIHILLAPTAVSQLASESVIILPSLGLQLETHKGFAGISMLAARTFIPWSALEDFLINEGIRGWDIRYYLVAITRTSHGSIKLEVAFEVNLESWSLSIANSQIICPIRTFSQSSLSYLRCIMAFKTASRWRIIGAPRRSPTSNAQLNCTNLMSCCIPIGFGQSFSPCIRGWNIKLLTIATTKQDIEPSDATVCADYV